MTKLLRHSKMCIKRSLFLALSAQVPLPVHTRLNIVEKSHHHLCWVDINSPSTILTCLYIAKVLLLTFVPDYKCFTSLKYYDTFVL